MAQMRQGSLFFPLTVNGENIRHCWITRQHLMGFLIQQYIDLCLRVVLPQAADDWRDQQHIAMVAQFNDQNTLYG